LIKSSIAFCAGLSEFSSALNSDSNFFSVPGLFASNFVFALAYSTKRLYCPLAFSMSPNIYSGVVFLFAFSKV